MQNEKDILLNIHTTVYDFTKMLIETKIKLLDITKDINRLDNNFFLEEKDEVHSKLMLIFDTKTMQDLTHVLMDYNNIIKDKLINCCNHEWIEDDVDIGFDKTKTICYCRLCETSKKC
jgi:hypothetical protein